MNRQKMSGYLFVAFPIAVQIPFTLLTMYFRYPDILREPAAKVLESFHAGGAGLILAWYAYALSIAMFVAAILLSRRRGSEEWIGLFSAAAQAIALLRWTFLVPYLAQAHASASPDLKLTIEAIFQAQHLYLGVGLGEYVGQLTLAVWTVLAARPGLRWLGWASAALFVIGTLEPLTVALNLPAGGLAVVPMIAFLSWSVWLVGYGITIIRNSGRG